MDIFLREVALQLDVWHVVLEAFPEQLPSCLYVVVVVVRFALAIPSDGGVVVISAYELATPWEHMCHWHWAYNDSVFCFIRENSREMKLLLEDLGCSLLY